ncbi:hypothetical protein KFK09_014917 [Dendrobium nobile]|uniref:Uncharacterized protein n=1 Tax=Dendrobium nobile TaxID=94219 RepID=A0A8T3B3D3_DENNO|nr:hypothetical protein KFK09_014917 [Dendrobium nobile]
MCFFEGPIVLKVWLYFNYMFNSLTTTRFSTIGELVTELFVPTKCHIRNILPILFCLFLWRSRNDSKHDNIKMDASTILYKVKNKIFQLCGAKLLKALFMCHLNLVKLLLIILLMVLTRLFTGESLWRVVLN